MKCNSTSSNYQTRILGGLSSASCAYDCSYGYRYTFTTGTARFMYSNVYENGYSYAVVQCVTSGITASGVWSPDSVPQSGVLPPSDHT